MMTSMFKAFGVLVMRGHFDAPGVVFDYELNFQ
jgi:hypothetical protein